MIDLRALRDDPDAFRASQRARGESEHLVDEVIDLDARRRESLAAFEAKRAEQKSLGKLVAQAQGEEKAELLARTKALAAEVKALEAEANELAAQAEEKAYRINNLVIPGIPEGGEDDYVVLRHVGTPRDFEAEGVEIQDHLAIGEGLKAIDTERGAKVSGSRFYFLTGVGARLELALLNAAMDKAVARGLTPVITPTLVKPEVMAGTGFLGAHASEVYHLPADDLYLVGTSEVALAGFHSGEKIGRAHV